MRGSRSRPRGVAFGSRRSALARGEEAESYLKRIEIYPFSKTGQVISMVRKQHDAWDVAAACMAGTVAENLYTRSDWWPSRTAFDDIPDIDIDDLHMAEAEIAPLDTPDRKAEMWRAWAAAHHILTAEWPPLLAVAAVLQERFSLSAEDFEAIWRGAQDA